MEWLHGAVDYGIIGVLVLMSVLAVAIAIERKYCYRKIQWESFTDRHELELQLNRH